MGRPSKCPGCKVLKSAHGFGRPGKHCPGPDLAEDEPANASVPGSVVDMEENLAPSEATNSAVVTTDRDLLQSLVDSVHRLSNEVREIRHETQDLRKFVPPRSADLPPSSSQVPPATSRVTLPELRAMTDLASKVERRVEHFGLIPSEDSDSDLEGVPCQNDVSPSHPTHSQNSAGKLKSGREAKPTSSVLYPQLWPQSFICLTRAQREVIYEDLSLAEFVAGYAQILQSKDISALERSERLKHLVSLMYFAQQFEWSAVLNFHGAVLLEIERGLLKWGDSFMHLESRTLYGHPLPDKSSLKSSIKSSVKPSSQVPILFCRDYQRDACANASEHYGYIRGERKWLKHICATCWVKNRKQEQHRENSADCPFTASGGSDSVAVSKN